VNAPVATDVKRIRHLELPDALHGAADIRLVTSCPDGTNLRRPTPDRTHPARFSEAVAESEVEVAVIPSLVVASTGPRCSRI